MSRPSGLRPILPQPPMNRQARAVNDRKQQAYGSHRIVRRHVRRFGKFELLNVKLRIGPSPGCPYL